MYKIYTFKFIQKEIRFDFEKCKELLLLTLNKHKIKNIVIYNDYDPKVGFHFNGIFKYHNYMELIKLYNKKSEFKHKNIFWWMTDLDNTRLIEWSLYCQQRHNDCHKDIITLSSDHNDYPIYHNDYPTCTNRISFT